MAIKTVRNTSNTVYTKVNYINFDATTKTVDKKYADVGDTLTYTIALPNHGNVAAIGVFFKDDIPEGTKFIDGSLSVNGILRPNDSPMQGLNVGNIAPNQTLTIQFKVQVLNPIV
ncbi:MAG: DUF11 domain-containing protein [Clostridium sp.]|uniref:DUF11 domain-containing protein n=1 Tax=Clostridium sp. TaxID=1506 RepID=UPI003F2ACD8B